MNATNDKVTVVTLVRGKSYTYFHEGRYYEYKRSVGVEVMDEGLVDALENLTETVQTSDGDEIEKDLFRVDRGASRRAIEDGLPKRKRLRIIQEDVPSNDERQAAPARKPIGGGFKARTPR